jgi:hypothetical protein
MSMTRKLSAAPGFKNPSPALLRRAPSPLGEGCGLSCAVMLGKLPSPSGGGCPAADVFTSRSGTGEGSVGRGRSADFMLFEVRGLSRCGPLKGADLRNTRVLRYH